MKKILMIISVIMLTMWLPQDTAAQEAATFDVFITDKDGPYTNVRNAPKGDIVGRIPTNHIIGLIVKTGRNGWLIMDGNSYYDYDTDSTHVIKSSKGCWIHYSVIAVSTRNYGGQTLRLREKDNKKSKVVYSFNNEIMLRPIEIRDNGWVLVSTADGKHKGWIEIEWLCGNPLTNCC